ncbi:PTH2 [Candida pseudojiufengensis]|uniref:PTH2 n=1 Tax=Candida pseudojiufengensis TaxID=497109 RepID=UPI00222548DB|nr:PTH2 [Candida pseudojiufengensis]KAI5964230.1 PTH2 [Candida pseudojiufengensis]
MNSDLNYSHNSTSYSTLNSSLNSNTDNNTTHSNYGSTSSASSLSSGEEEPFQKSNRPHLRQPPFESSLPHLNTNNYSNSNSNSNLNLNSLPNSNSNQIPNSIPHSSTSFSPSPSPPKSNSLQNSHIITYIGRIYSILDALLLIEACRLKMLPIINRRLTILERSKFIKPNTIFIWNETSCGMKRWTDGKIWSASKVYNGNFLQYKELNKFTKKEETNGLIKQSYSLTTKTNQRFHLISYFKNNYHEDFLNNVNNNSGSMDFSENLNLVNIPSHDPKLKGLKLSNDIYPDHSLHTLNNNSPLVEKSKLQQQQQQQQQSRQPSFSKNHQYHHHNNNQSPNVQQNQQNNSEHNSIVLPPQLPHFSSNPNNLQQLHNMNYDPYINNSRSDSHTKSDGSIPTIENHHNNNTNFYDKQNPQHQFNNYIKHENNQIPSYRSQQQQQQQVQHSLGPQQISQPQPQPYSTQKEHKYNNQNGNYNNNTPPQQLDKIQHHAPNTSDNEPRDKLQDLIEQNNQIHKHGRQNSNSTPNINSNPNSNFDSRIIEVLNKGWLK